MIKEKLLIIDLGAHNNQRVAKIARLSNVYCEVLPADKFVKNLDLTNVKGCIYLSADEESSQNVEAINTGLAELHDGNNKAKQTSKHFYLMNVAFLVHGLCKLL